MGTIESKKNYYTCEDCIHCVLCENTSDLLAPELCDFFKDRSKFIILTDRYKSEVLSNLKKEITKINEGLFWANENSTREYKYSEMLEIKEVLAQVYDIILNKSL